MERIHRVDDHPDERVPFDGQPAAVNGVYMVGTHPCIITERGIHMACRNCKRYVTTYQGKWRNLGRSLDLQNNQSQQPRSFSTISRLS
eukprot:6468831-Amphidinium_carterae.1